MSGVSPFTANRFEFEGRHLYYLPEDVFRPLEEAAPAYLIGTRGTGKTTLLKALNWENRLYDEHLRNQLGEDPFRARYIGVYLKLPKVHIGLIDDWSRDYGPRHELFVSLFLELLWSELMLEAVAGLLVEGIIEASPREEQQCAASLRDELSGYRALDSDPTERAFLTLRDIHGSLRRGRQNLQSAALAQADPSSEVARYPTDAPGASAG